MSATVDSVVLGALRLLGAKEAGEVATADESADGLVLINEVFEEWNLARYMQTSTVELTQTLTSSDGNYTFGTGGDNSTRPVKIVNGFIRDSSGFDHQLRIIDYDQYSSINLKSTSVSIPYSMYCRYEYPLAVVHLWPVPSDSNTLHLEAYAAFPATTAGATIDLAPSYIKALKYQLARTWAPEFKLRDTFPLVEKIFQETQAWIKRINKQDRPRMSTGVRQALQPYGYTHGSSGW